MTLDNRSVRKESGEVMNGIQRVREIDWEWLESTRRLENSRFLRVELEQLTSAKRTPINETVEAGPPKSSLLYSLPAAARGSSSRQLHKRWFAKDANVRESWHDRVTESLEVSEFLSRCPVEVTEALADSSTLPYTRSGAQSRIIGFDHGFDASVGFNQSFDASPENLTQSDYADADYAEAIHRIDLNHITPLLTPTHNFILLSREVASSASLELVAPSLNDEVESEPSAPTENEQIKHELIQLEQAVARKGGRNKRERGRKKSKRKGNLSPVDSNTNFSQSEARLIAK